MSRAAEEERLFPNGDIFVGSLQCNLLAPQGTGKYVWRDGCMYEGEWVRGKMSGKGKMSWPSGATYEGEFMCGYIHGMGSFTGVDGSTYTGQWYMNQKRGVGTKMYANGDVYEGSWMRGVAEGVGRYMWNGSGSGSGSGSHSNGKKKEYVGDWKAGVMWGRGVMTWCSNSNAAADTYDGQWVDGQPHGHGVYTWGADGSSYVGTWANGLKHGKGRYYSYSYVDHHAHAGHHNIRGPYSDEEDDDDDDDGASLASHLKFSQSSCSSSSPSSSSSSCISDDVNAHLITNECTNVDSSIVMSTSGTGLWPDWLSLIHSSSSSSSSSSSNSNVEDKCLLWDSNPTTTGPGSGKVDEEEESARGRERVVVFEREYVQGVLINEAVVAVKEEGEGNIGRKGGWKQRSRRREQPLGSRGRGGGDGAGAGETIYKGHHSYDLMLNLQLGIRYTVGKITPEPMRDICPSSDFGPKARIWMNFPKQGSQLTPPHHHSTDFKWKDYCPVVFRHLREMFKIDTADYMLSICGNSGLRELSSPGKSGSVFYLSHDDRFMIKTMRKAEVKVLLAMLPNYFKHVQAYENTLITKFFGLHRIKPEGGQKVRFVVMGNMFCTELRIHRRFDLKGSSQGRSADKVEINENTTLKDLDLDFVFRLEPSWRQALLRQIECDCKFLESQHIMDYSFLLGVHFRAPQFPAIVCRQDAAAEEGLVLVAHKPDTNVRPPPTGSHVRGSPLKASAGRGDDEQEIDLLLPGTARLRVQLGVNMPARADRSTEVGDSYDVVLYFGVIDILQEYDISKKLEHAYKSLQFDALSISAVNPSLYSRRFQNFIQKTFPESSKTNT